MNKKSNIKNMIRQTMFVDEDITGVTVWYAGKAYHIDGIGKESIEDAVNRIFNEVYAPFFVTKKKRTIKLVKKATKAFGKISDNAKFVVTEARKISDVIRDDIDEKYGVMRQLIQM